MKFKMSLLGLFLGLGVSFNASADQCYITSSETVDDCFYVYGNCVDPWGNLYQTVQVTCTGGGGHVLHRQP